MTSSILTARSAGSEHPVGADVNVGGGASAVVARTAATLLYGKTHAGRWLRWTMAGLDHPEPIDMLFRVLRAVPDVIIHTKFYVNRLWGFSAAAPRKASFPMLSALFTISFVLSGAGSKSGLVCRVSIPLPFPHSSHFLPSLPFLSPPFSSPFLHPYLSLPSPLLPSFHSSISFLSFPSSSPPLPLPLEVGPLYSS